MIDNRLSTLQVLIDNGGDPELATRKCRLIHHTIDEGDEAALQHGVDIAMICLGRMSNE